MKAWLWRRIRHKHDPFHPGPWQLWYCWRCLRAVGWSWDNEVFVYKPGKTFRGVKRRWAPDVKEQRE